MKNALTPKASSHLHLFKKEFRNRLGGSSWRFGDDLLDLRIFDDLKECGKNS